MQEKFDAFPNVIAKRHKCSGVRHCVDDKRFVIKEALDHFDYCLYMDSDCRLLGRVPIDGLVESPENIFVNFKMTMREKIDDEFETQAGYLAGSLRSRIKINSPDRIKVILESANIKLGLDIENCDFSNEVFFGFFLHRADL